MLLQGSGRECDQIEIERRWASTWVGAESAPEGAREILLENLIDNEARQTLQQRFPSAKSDTGSNSFSTLLVRDKLNRQLLASGVYTDADLLFEDLRKANHSGLLGKIRIYLATLRKLPEDDPLIPFRKALDEALVRLSNENALNRVRINQILAEAGQDQPSE